jgi:probable rRNA maturation factor
MQRPICHKSLAAFCRNFFSALPPHYGAVVYEHLICSFDQVFRSADKMAKKKKSPAKKRAVKTLPAKAPRIDVMLTRRSGAPAKPAEPELMKLFERAWTLVPPSRRADILGQKRMAVDVLVIDDNEIAKLNVSHLKTRGPTDVLSFPMGEVDPERKAYHLGEVVVSFETAKREAQARKISVDEELQRYCAHGFLHLLGYDDATHTQREEMFALQEQALKGK